MNILKNFLGILIVIIFIFVIAETYSTIAEPPPTAEERNAAFKEQCGYNIPNIGDKLFFKHSNHTIVVNSVWMHNAKYSIGVIYPQTGRSGHENCRLFQPEKPMPKIEDLRK